MKGTQTHLEFIPERTTDFIFAAFAEEFGLAGCVALIAGFIFLIFRGLMIAADAPTVFTRLLAGAITLSFFAYAFVNMGMVSGILPVVGVPLPFISYGGTAMVTLGLGPGHPDVDRPQPAPRPELNRRRRRGGIDRPAAPTDRLRRGVHPGRRAATRSGAALRPAWGSRKFRRPATVQTSSLCDNRPTPKETAWTTPSKP